MRISIHALREEGEALKIEELVNKIISIHALREEGELGTAALIQSKEISIHALREEGDDGMGRLQGRRRHFYPRPPRGGRRVPTRPRMPMKKISIHALREEGDTWTWTSWATT